MLDPSKPIEHVALRGQRVALEPLSAAHLPGLAAAVSDGELWKLPFTFVPHPDEVPGFLEWARARYDAQLERQFVTVDIATASIVGSTRFMNIDRKHRRLEIGFTFIAESWQRTCVNTEAKYLMLRHAFEAWGCNRVELITDALNLQSRRAIKRIGATEEGILRSHMIMRDGRLRDSVLSSVVKADWPRVRQGLEAMLRVASPVMSGQGIQSP